jgi:hypothetical protein
MQAPSGKATGAFSLRHITGYATKDGQTGARAAEKESDSRCEMRPTPRTIGANRSGILGWAPERVPRHAQPDTESGTVGPERDAAARSVDFRPPGDSRG